MTTGPQDLILLAREYLTRRRFIQRAAEAMNSLEVLEESRKLEGFDRAYESVHVALWKWVDHEFSPSEQAKFCTTVPSDFDWKSVERKFDFASLHCSPELEKPLFVEIVRQERWLDLAGYKFGWRSADGKDQQFHRRYARSAYIADRIGLDEFAKLQARQFQRKPSESSDENRLLKYRLLFAWIPAALWACRNEGIARFYLTYGCNVDRVRKTISALGLFHLKKPVYREVALSPKTAGDTQTLKLIRR